MFYRKTIPLQNEFLDVLLTRCLQSSVYPPILTRQWP